MHLCVVAIGSKQTRLQTGFLPLYRHCNFLFSAACAVYILSYHADRLLSTGMLNLLKNVNYRFLAHGRVFSNAREFNPSPDGIGFEPQKPKTPKKTARFGRATSFSTSLSPKRTNGIIAVHKRLPAKKLKDVADAGRGTFDAGPTNKAQAATLGRRIPVSINKDPVEDFRRGLDFMLSINPQYHLKSVYKAIRQMPIASAYETAFDVLIKHKRPDDGANILLQMQKKGLLASNETLAKTMTMTAR